MPTGVIILAVFNFSLCLLTTYHSVSNFWGVFATERAGMSHAFLLLFGTVHLLAAVGYFLGGVGLLMKQRWGAILHLIMSGLTALNCTACCFFGFIYSVLSTVVTFQTDVWQTFYPPDPNALEKELIPPGPTRRQILPPE